MAGWRYSVEKGDLRLWGCRACTRLSLLDGRVLAETTSALGGLTGGKTNVCRRMKSLTISRGTAQNIHERDCCRSGRGGWDGKAKVWLGCTSLVPLVVPGRGRALVARDGGSVMEPVAGSKH